MTEFIIAQNIKLIIFEELKSLFGDGNIPSDNQEDIWKYLSNILTLIKIYKNDFREENDRLTIKEKEIKVLIKKEKQSNIDLAGLKLFCKKEWKILILKATSNIKNKIKSRITKGIGFNDIIIQIDKIEDALIDLDDYEIEWFENTYNYDVIPLRQDTKERIDNERFNIIFTIIIALGSIIVGAIVGAYLQKWGWLSWIK